MGSRESPRRASYDEPGIRSKDKASPTRSERKSAIAALGASGLVKNVSHYETNESNAYNSGQHLSERTPAMSPETVESCHTYQSSNVIGIAWESPVHEISAARPNSAQFSPILKPSPRLAGAGVGLADMSGTSHKQVPLPGAIASPEQQGTHLSPAKNRVPVAKVPYHQLAISRKPRRGSNASSVGSVESLNSVHAVNELGQLALDDDKKFVGFISPRKQQRRACFRGLVSYLFLLSSIVHLPRFIGQKLKYAFRDYKFRDAILEAEFSTASVYYMVDHFFRQLRLPTLATVAYFAFSISVMEEHDIRASVLAGLMVGAIVATLVWAHTSVHMQTRLPPFMWKWRLEVIHGAIYIVLAAFLLFLQHQNGYYGFSSIETTWTDSGPVDELLVECRCIFLPVLVLYACMIETNFTPKTLTALYALGIVGLGTWVGFLQYSSVFSASGSNIRCVTHADIPGDSPSGWAFGVVAMIIQWLLFLCARVHEEEIQRERYVRVVASFDAQADVNLVLENLYPEQV